MARESIFDVDLGLDDAVKLLERSRDLVNEIGAANKNSLDATTKQKQQYSEINDALSKQRLEMARMSADFAEQLRAMQVSGLSKEQIEAAKQKFQNEKDIAKLAEDILGKQKLALQENNRIEIQNEDKLHRRRLLHFKDLRKAAESVWDITKYTAGTALGVAAAGALGGVAFGGMAYSAGDERKRAMGLGASTAQIQALRHTYGSIFSDPESMLGLVYDMQRDASQVNKLRLLFQNDKELNSAEKVSSASSFDIVAKLPLAIKDALDKIKKENPNARYLDTAMLARYGADLISRTDYRLIDSTKRSELLANKAALPQSLQEMSLADDTSKRWQDLQKRLGLSGQGIENTALKTLEKLAPQLSELSKGITNVIAAVGKSHVVATAIDKTASALNKFTKYLGTKDATEDIEGFLESLDIGAGYVYSFADGVGAAGRAMGLLDERSLKGSEYRKIAAIAKINPELANLLKESEENPSNIAARNMAIRELGYFQEPTKARFRAIAGGSFSDILNGQITPVRSWKGSFLEAMSFGGNDSNKKSSQGITSIYDDQFTAMGRKYGIDPALLKAQAYAESGLNPNNVSPAGAVGLSQFMPETARTFGLKNRKDPIDSIRAQAQYMRKLLDMFGGDTEKALAGYNWGENKVLKKGRNFSDLPSETQNYISRINELMSSGKIKVIPQPKPRTQNVNVNVNVNAAHGLDAGANVQRLGY